MSDELSLRVSNLLALAIQAQGQGNHELADQLTERALKLLEDAYGTVCMRPQGRLARLSWAEQEQQIGPVTP